MIFSHTCTLSRVMLEFKVDAFRFHCEEPCPIDVSLRTAGTKFPVDALSEDAVCSLNVEKEPDAIVRSMFEQLSRGKLPDDYNFPFPQPPRNLDEEGGPRKLTPQVVFMPKIFQDFVHETFLPMNKAVIRIFDILRWRFNRHGASLRRLPDGDKFSFDNETWHDMPSWVDPYKARLIDSFTGTAFGEPEAFALRTELQAGSTEPLAHALFREAWELRLRSARSSLLIGFTAAEAGVKRLIVRMMPITKNLIMRLPSPPIKDLLNYIDDVPSKSPSIGNGNRIPRSIRKSMIEMSLH